LTDPVGRTEDVTAIALIQHLDSGRSRDAEVRRFAAHAGEPLEGAPRELHEVEPGGLPARVTEEHRPGLERSAGRVALNEPLALERADEAGGRALRQTREMRELADRRCAVFFDDEHEQLRSALHRLCSRLTRHGNHPVPMIWNGRSTP